jgi:ERCC4-type nuclease
MSKLTDKQINDILENNLTIILDSREKLPNHISKCFDKNNIKWRKEKLNYGDYSIEIDQNDLLDIQSPIKLNVSIERKMSLDEISNNLTRGRDRFKREMQRCNEDDGLMVIMIEDSTYEDIINKKYNANITPKQFLGSLHGITATYKVQFVFIKKKVSPLFIYNYLKYYARNYLKNLQ